MRDVVSDIRARGAALAIVGSGSPEQAAAFRDERELDFPLLVDPELNAFRAADLRRGLGASLNARTLSRGIRAISGGFRQGRTQGDPWQQGGCLVIGTDGHTALEQVAEGAGDHVDPEDILAALDRITA